MMAVSIAGFAATFTPSSFLATTFATKCNQCDPEYEADNFEEPDENATCPSPTGSFFATFGRSALSFIGFFFGIFVRRFRRWSRREIVITVFSFLWLCCDDRSNLIVGQNGGRCVGFRLYLNFFNANRFRFCAIDLNSCRSSCCRTFYRVLPTYSASLRQDRAYGRVNWDNTQKPPAVFFWRSAMAFARGR